MELKNISAKEVIDRYSNLGKIGTRDALKLIPKEERRYKCFTCFSIIESDVCPYCGETKIELMCPLDHCHCHHDVMPSIAHCPLCGEGVCPSCGCHDITQLSRVTGYLQEVGGWNSAKQQELKDRARYDPLTGSQVARM